MTQNPYAQQAGFETPMPVAPRTSVAAILALVCSLVCFIPGLSVLAIILGIAALVMISSSEGRVGGKGLAISGILIGLLVSVVWIGGLLLFRGAMGAFNTHLITPVSNVFQAIEKKDYSTARTLMNTPSGMPGPTDAEFDAFITAYHAEVGTFQNMPGGMFDYFRSFQRVQGFFQPTPGAPEMPIPTEFSQGTAVVLVEFPQGTNPGSSPNPSGLPIVNLGILSSSGNKIWLIPKGTTTPSTPSGGTPTGAPSGPP